MGKTLRGIAARKQGSTVNTRPFRAKHQRPLLAPPCWRDAQRRQESPERPALFPIFALIFAIAMFDRPADSAVRVTPLGSWDLPSIQLGDRAPRDNPLNLGDSLSHAPRLEFPRRTIRDPSSASQPIPGGISTAGTDRSMLWLSSAHDPVDIRHADGSKSLRTQHELCQSRAFLASMIEIYALSVVAPLPLGYFEGAFSAGLAEEESSACKQSTHNLSEPEVKNHG